MPKIIANLESRLMTEARRQLEEIGYEAVTIRSVASACGVGVGTVYNYFDSKEALLAAYLLEDWHRCVVHIQAASADSQESETVVRCIYDQLAAYSRRHQTVFRDKAAATAFATHFGKYHALLRSQLAVFLRKFVDSDFAADFTAEALLTWTLAKREFEEIFGMLRKLL